MKIIIQAGGKGTRLKQLTYNKPKCLVSINNLPMIMHLFELFKNEEFIVIGDYKFDVLKKYLETFANKYKYSIIKANNDGTTAGIKESLQYLNDKEPFIIVWCDLIMKNDFKLPTDLSKNYIGISKEYECRWSYIDGKFIKEPSKEDGVAGFFIFKNKNELADITESGSFVGGYLSNKNFVFERLNLFNSKEIGTMQAYNNNVAKEMLCRPFNSIEIVKEGNGEKIIKTFKTEQGKSIHENEVAWYKKIVEFGYKNIPQIFSFEPLIMERINGKNIFKYENLTILQKEKILEQIVNILKELHNLQEPIESSKECIINNYVDKTFDRLEKVKDLIPFAYKKEIVINDRLYKNPLFMKEKIEKVVNENLSKEFKIIHGDCTFSNIIYDEIKEEPVLIDPRGYFGKTKYFGDEYYDWAKLYYSLVGNYDQFNNGNFVLKINEDNVYIFVDSNNWENLEQKFFKLLFEIDTKKVKFIHSIIWLSLTTYAWDNYDSICGAFYNGVIKINEALNDYGII